MNIRLLSKAEYGVLPDFLYHAIHLPPGAAAPPQDIIRRPELSIYIDDFGGKDDCAMVCEEDGRIVGVAWTRVIPGYGHVDDETPELAISVLPEYRGRGIGTALMTSLFDELAGRGYEKLSLSEQKDNPAADLYLRLGFRILAENDEDYIMVRDLTNEAFYSV